MKKFAVMEIMEMLGEKCNKDVQIIKAETAKEAVEVYRQDRPYSDEIVAHDMGEDSTYYVFQENVLAWTGTKMEYIRRK